MHRFRAALLCVCLVAVRYGAAQEHSSPEPLPDANTIMKQVAAHQDAAEAERSHYVYTQHARMISRQGKNVRCEETTEYRFTPSESGTREELLRVEGRFLKDGKYVAYNALLPRDEDNPKRAEASTSTEAPAPQQHQNAPPDANHQETLDRDLVEHIRSNLIHDDSKDGINAHLFPLTSKEQANYTFRISGRERLNGHDVFHVIFRPRNPKDFGWSGDAYIDSAAYQPVLVTTAMARKVPFMVRTLLGTNVPGLGFTVRYAPQSDGVWFPVSFSTEFKIHALYFFRREVILDAENREFEKTHVTSRILDSAAAVE